MKDRDWLFGLKEISGVGDKTLDMLHQRLPNMGSLQHIEPGDLMKMGVTRNRARHISEKLNETFVAERYEQYRKAGIRVIVRGDAEYPDMLAHIPAAPNVIYVKGDAGLLNHPSIAVVGTRRATTYGRRAARKIVAELCAFGFGIVSGMARGIDAEAHRTSLNERAPSLAVLGTGLDIVYPKENAMLIERVAAAGALVSECPLGTPTHRGLFYLRNRIISGLSLGTLIVEADLRSGALITGKYATEQNRDVYCVPGSIFSDQSRGTLKWINDGAQCVVNGAEIAEQHKNIISNFDHTNIKGKIALMLTPDERLVLSHLSENEATIDELLEKTQLPFGHLHTVLLSLLLKKQIQKCSGSTYVSVH